MTEQTDKASRKTSKAATKKRPAKSRSPKSKRAKAPGRKTAEPEAGTEGSTATTGTLHTPESKPLAPDPATITFGSNRPIVAQPEKLPESSGLKFSGPSAGQLKASGPQPSSAKASGLTFTNAKGANGSGSRPASSAVAAAAEVKAPAARKPEGTKESSDKKAADSKAPLAAGKTEKAKGPAERPVFTKPAIAPQASGRRLEKERSSRGFAMTLLGLAVVVGGLAYWLNPGSVPVDGTGRVSGDLATLQPAPAMESAPAETPAVVTPERATIASTAPEPATPGTTTPGTAAGKTETPARAAATAEPASGPSPAAAPVAEAIGTPALSIAEIKEIQQLLQRLELAPGNIDGVLTADTSAAIRSYQEMAGLAGDGEANRALLEELRSVVELYGG